jgi:hypothetical protein
MFIVTAVVFDIILGAAAPTQYHCGHDVPLPFCPVLLVRRLFVTLPRTALQHLLAQVGRGGLKYEFRQRRSIPRRPFVGY